MMHFSALLQCVSAIKQSPLPDESSQLEMAPPYRNEMLLLQKNERENAKQAAVLALLYPNKDNIVHLILILRKTYKGVHSAQVGFPGGKVEKVDANLKETALREAEEEVGVNAKTVEVIKKMTSVYIPPSNYNVQPYLGITSRTPQFVKEEAEVEDLIEVPLKEFLNEDSVQTKTVTKNSVAIDVPAFKLNNHLVWGATAMMLNEIKQLLKMTLKC